MARLTFEAARPPDVSQAGMQGQASDLSASCLDFLAVSDLREPPQLIVITVIVVTLPVPMRVPRDDAYAFPS